MADRRPGRVINGDNGEPYLRRYFLFALGPATDPWCVAYLHHFVASDPDRGLHDHPWPWAWSAVLAGGYFEQVLLPGGRIEVRARLAGAHGGFDGEHCHRVVVPEGRDCWTFFIHGPWRKPWGFFRVVDRAPTAAIEDPAGRVGVRMELRYVQYSNQSSAGWWR